ncbi:glutathione S-transferase family protein [Vibrio sp.]|nr:glutathione S-transferase family protein [Vibrio sp.]
MKLIIGNQNYSTWSMRAWLIFSQCNVKAEIEKLTLFTPEFYDAIERVSPAKKVPALIDGDITVWDSLAILEYVNDSYLNGKAWPSSTQNKAKARSIACEMHSGFPNLRNELPMNCRAKRKVSLSPAALAEINRVDELWSEQMEQYPGQWLFGEWSIADAMYAPLALRFETYGIILSDTARHYQSKVTSSNAVKQWLAEASLETDIVDEDEAGEPLN